MRAFMIALTAICFVCINVFAFPLIAWLTFGGSEAWKIVWIIGAVLVTIFFNAGVVQLAYSIWRKRFTYFWIGLAIVAAEVVAFIALAFFSSSATWGFSLLLIAAFCSVVLLVVEIRTAKPRKAKAA